MKLCARGLSHERKKLLQEACYNICDNISIDRQLTRNIRVYVRNMNDVDGMTWYDGKVVHVIVCRTLISQPKPLFETLAHELVHARQYLHGDLQFKRKREYWKGELIKEEHSHYEHIMKMTDSAYKKLPWEREAYSISKKLLISTLKPFIVSWKKTMVKKNVRSKGS